MEANEDLFDFNKQVQDMSTPIGIILDTPILRTLVKSPLAPHIMPKVTGQERHGQTHCVCSSPRQT